MLGKKREKTATKRHVEWVKENLPMLAMQGQAAIEALVLKAEEAVGPYQYGLAFLTAFVPTFVGPAVVRALFGDEPTEVESLGTLAAIVAVCAIVSFRIYEGILHRKIESLASSHGT